MTMRLPTAAELQEMYARHEEMGLPTEVMQGVVQQAMERFDAWTAGDIVQMPWLYVATMQYGDFCSGATAVYPCLCGTTFTNRKGFTRHFGRCDVANMEAEKMQDRIPTHPSNRTIIKQLRLWGVEVVERKGKPWHAKFPNGNTIEVLSPHVHDGNPTQTFLDIYRHLGVTPNDFWSKDPEPETVEAPSEEPKRTVNRGHSTMVLDILLGQNRPLTISSLAELTGLTHQQISAACYYLTSLKPPLARRVKTGLYEATQERRPDHMVGIDVTVGDRPAGTPSVSAPDRPLEGPVSDSVPQGGAHDAGRVVMRPTPTHAAIKREDEMDVLIIDFLDMIFPDGFSARHLMAIDRWRAATKDLFREMEL